MNDSASSVDNEPPLLNLMDLLKPVVEGWKWVGAATVAGAALGIAASHLIAPTFLSTTTFLPPQQQQSSASAALASLGALAGLAGGAVKTPGDQYVALMQSVTVQDRIIDKFGLMAIYEAEFRQDARLAVKKFTQISLGKKDGLIDVTVEDTDPKRAAAIANQYVEELRTMLSALAMTEAQQRRVFFEKQWQDAKTKLAAAQAALEKSGITGAVLKAEPKAAAEAYGRLRAELTTAEIKLRTLRTSLADGASEILQLTTTVQTLRQRLKEQEASATGNGAQDADYVSRYREFKYQETMFELMAKQYELARVDESREGSLIQVVDVAQPAERKSKPKRSAFALAGLAAGLVLSAGLLVWRQRQRTRSSQARQ